MKLSAICIDLDAALYEACRRYISRLTTDLKGQNIYAFTILLTGPDDMGVAANTVESLTGRVADQESIEPAGIRLPHFYIQMSAAEWIHMNGYWEVFSPVNTVLATFMDRLETHAAFDDLADNLNYDQICALAEKRFQRTIVSVLRRLKDVGEFVRPGFVDDVFLGVQYSDIGAAEMSVIEAVSNQLNSKYWASRIGEFKAYLQQASS